MQSQTQQSSRKFSSPRGVTIVEFLGCLVALGGGVALGLVYLGVDVQTLAAGVLEKADIKVPALLSEETQVGKTAPVDEAPSENQLLSFPGDMAPGDTGAEEIALEPSEVATAGVETDSETVSSGASQVALTDAEKLAATHDCWVALNVCLREEAEHRSKSITKPGSWQLFDYLLHRQKGHQKVVEAIELLDHQGVDPRLETYVAQVLTWHRSGADLFDRAAQLLTDAPAGKLTGPFAQSWQSAATQHRMEEKLILNKHAAVANYLEHSRYTSAAASLNE